MTGTIKVEVDAALAKRFMKNAMKTDGYKKKTMKQALEDLMIKFSQPGKADWRSLRGTLKSKKTSIELQHQAWSKVN